MNNKEFSDGFDTMLSSYSVSANFGEEASKQTIVLDEYEKSLFLTKAQEELVVGLYNGKNQYGESFEGTEELRRYLSSLIVERNLKPLTNTIGTMLGASSTSKFFTLPTNLWFITYETVTVSDAKCKDYSTLKVYPTRQDEYQVIKENPFRGANDRRALRLDLSDGNVEIICKHTVVNYYIRYVRKVSPIILVDLPDGLSIGGTSKTTECTLHDALHQRILDLAVRMALQSKGISRRE